MTILTLVFLSSNILAQNSLEQKWIHTETQYSDSNGNSFELINSLPKGGQTYTDSAGITYSYVIFWNRIINNAELPLEINLQFPAKKIEIFPSSDSYLRIFLPSEQMTSEKIAMFDYGLTSLKDFLDAEFYEQSFLEKTILPKEEYSFYISILIHHARGSARTALVMEDNNAFYQISIGSNSGLIPCGEIIFKN